MLEINCPSCGAKVPFQSAVSLLAACPYCRSLVMREDLNVEDLGKAAALQPDGSPVQLGVRGEFGATSFSVLGRIQMRYPEGYWNEWFLGFDDGRQGWLGEAQGLYAVSFPASGPAGAPPYEELHIGQELSIDGKVYMVRDKRPAQYVSMEGELPFQAPLGEEGCFADLSGDEQRFATIDYSQSPPLVFAGSYVEFKSLRFNGLKAVEGW